MDIQDQIHELSLRELNALVESADKRRRELEHQHRKERERLDVELVHDLPHGFNKVSLGATVRPWIKDMIDGMSDDIALALEEHAKANKLSVKRQFNHSDLIELLLLNHLPQTSYVDGRLDDDRLPLLFEYDDDENGDRRVKLDDDFVSNFVLYRRWTKSHHNKHVKEHDKIKELVTAVPFRSEGGDDDE